VLLVQPFTEVSILLTFHCGYVAHVVSSRILFLSRYTIHFQSVATTALHRVVSYFCLDTGCRHLNLDIMMSSHIAIRYHYIRELYEMKIIDVSFRGTEDMPADMFTEPLPRQKIEHLSKLAGLATA
jgi:hypothetical protein